MSNQYPGFHTHVENGYPGEKGQKGQSGVKGETGQHGRVTEIQFAFTNKTPADLLGNQIPKNWDGEGSPRMSVSMRPGESVVYTVDNSIWTYLPMANDAGWKQTGTVNGDIYTVAGEKGDTGDGGLKGDVGPQGHKGETGEKGVPGEVAAKGDLGEKGVDGARGEKGQKGDRGLDGPTGDKGTPGETGAPGENGFNGQDGTDGTDGIDGSPGQKGEPGQKGSTPGIETVPVMLVSYDGVNDLIKNRYNLDVVNKIGTGNYRFRLKDKTQGGEFAVTNISVFETNGEFIYAQIARQTDRIVEIQCKKIDYTPIDCHVNLVMYNPIV